MASRLSPSAGSSPPDLLVDAALLAYWRGSDLTDGAISLWDASYGSGRVVQATGASQPTASSGVVTFDGTDDYLRPSGAVLLERTRLPDGASGSAAGVGFTCVGLVRNSDGTFWVGNFAQSGTGEVGPSSVVLMNSTFTTIQREILLNQFNANDANISGTTNQDLQGLAKDASGNLYCAINYGAGRGVVVFAPGAGEGNETYVASYAVTDASGLAYDDTRGVLYVSDNITSVKVCNPTTGAVSTTYDIGDAATGGINPGMNNLDHIGFDPSEPDLIYAFWGGNVVDGGNVTRYSISRVLLADTWNLPGCHAPEGMAFSGAELWACSDEGFHTGIAGSDEKNSVIRYRMPWVTSGSQFGVIWRGNLAATPNTNNHVFSIGDGITNSNLGGLTLLPKATSLVVYLDGPAGGTGDRDILTWNNTDGGGFDTLTDTIWEVWVDVGAGTASLYAANTLITTKSLTNFVAAFPRLPPGMGASWARIDAALGGNPYKGDIRGVATISGTRAGNAALVAAVLADIAA